jgi:NADP-dependent 3-hydroxy acid dehydrogenase YdfG
MEKRDKLEGSVVVLTGASSGIGRAAALMFAGRGAKLVLAARDGAALDLVVKACEQRGAEAIAVPTDVRDEASVEALRDLAVHRFGRIDVWVNDAAVYMMGLLESTPLEAVRDLLSTNVIGVLHGARAALVTFRAQGHGTLITMGSVAGKVTYAQAGAYCASKHAVHAIHECLRQEVQGSGIDVCLIVPASVDTPLFQHAANYTGREIVAMHPVDSPERVAAAIVRCAERPRRELRVGLAPRLMTLFARLLPRIYERTQPRMVMRDRLGRGGVPSDPGNFLEAIPPHAVHGGWRERRALKARQSAQAAPRRRSSAGNPSAGRARRLTRP